MALPGYPDHLRHSGPSVTSTEAEQVVLDFLRTRPGCLVGLWELIHQVAKRYASAARQRREDRFYLEQVMRLIREKKIVRYRTRQFPNMLRISEAHR